MPRSLTRAVRLLVLARRWLAYLLWTDDRRLAFSDLLAWLSTTVGRQNLLGSATPWISFAAARFLDAEIRPGWRVFEWGSGGSTAFFSRRGCTVVSVEHDPEWHARVASALERRPDVDLLLIPPQTSESSDDDEAKVFAAYAAAIDPYPVDGFDAVLVDGRARALCLARAGDKVRKGGLVLLDDSERTAYSSSFGLFSADRWEVLHFPGPRPASIWPVFGRTTAFRKRSPRSEDPRESLPIAASATSMRGAE
jgi:hypothetical protein